MVFRGEASIEAELFSDFRHLEVFLPVFHHVGGCRRILEFDEKPEFHGGSNSKILMLSSVLPSPSRTE